jgi:predicted nucleic-acid-binding protein
MVIFDTNVILRYILHDNQAMVEQVEEQLSINICFIPIEVIAEIIYVLSKVYCIEREIITQVVTDITDTENIMVAQTDVVRHALQVYSSTALDFVDCLLIGYAKEKKYTVFTFDKKLQQYLKK